MKKKYDEWNAPKKIYYWFIETFVRDENAREFAHRYHGIIDPDELTTDQRKKLNYYTDIGRRYDWLNFRIEKIDHDIYAVIPRTPAAEWCNGTIDYDEDNQIRYSTRARSYRWMADMSKRYPR